MRQVLILYATFLLYFSLPAQEIIRCGHEWLQHKQSHADSVSVSAREADMERKIKKEMSVLEQQSDSRETIVIPVVVHIVWNKPVENLDDTAVISEIAILNRHFNNEHSDLSKVPDEFKSVIGKPGIRFCLAAEDPQGNPTNGIIRVHTNIPSIGITDSLYHHQQGGSDAWDVSRYLNIWVASTVARRGTITGFARFPDSIDVHRDGIVIYYECFGAKCTNLGSQGRLVIHEVGHYLSLRHIWGDAWGCDTDDGIEDTPLQNWFHAGSPTYPQYSCGTSNMFMNYMDYSDDSCLIMFTKQQVLRMMAAMHLYRPAFLHNTIPCFDISTRVSDIPFKVFPNPAYHQISIEFPDEANSLGKIEIYDLLGILRYEKEGVLLRGVSNLQLPEDLGVGIYFVKIGKKTQKIIIN